MPRTIEPPTDFRDPRERPDFVPDHWPLLNGETAPTLDEAGSDFHLRRCIQFLAAFYDVNRCNAALLEARTAETAIQAHVKAVGSAMDALEAIEDQYTPVGFFGEPMSMDGPFYRDIKFIRPGLPRLPASSSSVSSHINVPGLEFLPPSELEGEITIERWT